MSFRQPSAATFSVVIGGYVGLLALGVTGLVLGTDYVTWWPVAVGGSVGVLVAVCSYTQAGLATRLVRARLYLLPMAVPILILFLAPAFALLGSHGYEGWVMNWLAELFVASLAGGLVFFVTVNRHVAFLHERESVLVEWTAPPDARYRRLLRASKFVLGCSCLVVGFGLVVAVETEINLLPAFGGAVLGQALTVGRPRTYTLFESGLCVHQSKTIGHQFVPRSQLRAVDLGEERLEIDRGLPWPLPIRCATGAMARPDRVADAIVRSLESDHEAA
ncbi:hypothetical protein [Natrinema marinum]|uniref:hypothetical protein n=1 Tax=Natrinema marinum TaxID=2961598 RepID=UPI0020C8D406|nr:hypothetical protein [Natrinema marinum]